MTRGLTILGATGSVGSQTLDMVARNPGRWRVEAITAGSDVAALASAAKACGARFAAIADAARGAALKEALAGSGIDSGAGASALVDAAARDAEIVITAIVGAAGLPPTMAAVQRGAQIGIANKETLVCAGPVVMAAAAAHGATLLPVDSEHNAIFQVFPHDDPRQVERIILTASGGPFRTWPAANLGAVTPEQALKHPTWTMGAKITIDSATLFNKGLEMIEARWLFDVEMARVEVIVHPQSIVHSMVEFIDSSILAQLSTTDMCFPIQYAVTWPDRVPNSLPPLDFAKLAKLEFEAPRIADFPALSLARTAGETGGTLPAVLNAVNEVAVAAFLQRRCTFPAIWETVARVMSEHRSIAGADLDAILSADSWARTRAGELLTQ